MRGVGGDATLHLNTFDGGYEGSNPIHRQGRLFVSWGLGGGIRIPDIRWVTNPPPNGHKCTHTHPCTDARTRAHRNVENRKTRTKQEKRLKENSSGTAELSYTSFGLLVENEQMQFWTVGSARRSMCLSPHLLPHSVLHCATDHKNRPRRSS